MAPLVNNKMDLRLFRPLIKIHTLLKRGLQKHGLHKRVAPNNNIKFRKVNNQESRRKSGKWVKQHGLDSQYTTAYIGISETFAFNNH